MSVNTKYNYNFYRWCHKFIGPIILLFRPIEVIGKENLTDGAAVICANHSALIDPFLVALSFDVNNPIHVLAKAELYKIPVISFLLRKLGTISVDRSKMDFSSVKSSMSYLKKAGKILIFPEGTRASDYDEGAAKVGAVKLAERSGAPIIPVFIPRKKPFFVRSRLIFGKPYIIDKEKRSAQDYERLSDELMKTVESLSISE